MVSNFPATTSPFLVVLDHAPSHTAQCFVQNGWKAKWRKPLNWIYHTLLPSNAVSVDWDYSTLYHCKVNVIYAIFFGIPVSPVTSFSWPSGYLSNQGKPSNSNLNPQIDGQLESQRFPGLNYSKKSTHVFSPCFCVVPLNLHIHPPTTNMEPENERKRRFHFGNYHLQLPCNYRYYPK